MKTFFICLIVLAALGLAYRACSGRHGLDVDPHARREIEKAKRK